MADTTTPEELERLDRQTRLMRDLNKEIAKQKEAITESKGEYDKLNQARDKALASLKEKLSVQEDIMRRETELLTKSKALAETDRAGHREALRQAAEKSAFLSDQINELGGMQDKYKDLAKTIKSKFGIKTFDDSFFGKLAKEGGSLQDAVLELGKGMKEAFKPENIGLTLLAKFAENTRKITYEQEELLAEFGRVTGAARSYDNEIQNLVGHAGALATGQASVIRTYKDLRMGFTEFTFLTKEQRNSIGRLAIALEGLGVSGGESSQAMQTLTKSFGISADESEKSLTTIANLARDIEVPPSQMIQDLNATGPALAKFGKKADDVFRKMSTSAKQLGSSVSELMGALSQYDTFESAATAAGRLNSILGGPLLNSVNLLNASEDERLKMLMQAVEASNKSWDAMNKFERQAIANAAGITDMALANKMFGQTFAAYERGQRELNKYNQSQKDLEAAAQANITLEMRKKQITEAYSVALTGVRQAMASILGTILEWNEALGGMLIPFVGITVSIAMLVGKIKILWTLFTGGKAIMAAAATGIGGVGGTAGGAAMGVWRMGLAMKAAAPHVLKFGVSTLSLIPILLTVAGVLAGIGALVAGVGSLFGGGDDDDDEETVKKAKRISDAAKATDKLKEGITAITAMKEPLSIIETSIDHIVEKINTMNTSALLLAGVTLSAAAPVAAIAAATQPEGGGKAADVMADKVAKAVGTAMSNYEVKFNDRVLIDFINNNKKRI